MGLRVVIPVAGVGSRLRPHTHTAPKVMLQVAGKPMIGHILDELKQYDVERIILVVGHLGDCIREYVSKAYDFDFEFVTQDELLGLGHAIWLTRAAYGDGDNPLLIILGDTIFDADFRTIIGSDINWIGVKEVDDPRRFGIVETDGEHISNMVEKPEQPSTNLAIVGIYYFAGGGLLYRCLDELIEADRRTKGEYQLTDALQMMLERGSRMKPFKISGWHDCGKPDTLLATNRTLLEKHQGAGRRVDPAAFPGVLINEPVAIGANVKLENSIIGPYVSVADGVTIRNAIVQNSTISHNATVENLLIVDSIIADNARACGALHGLNVGDSSEIRLS